MTKLSVYLFAVILGLFAWFEIGALPGFGASADESVERTLVVAGVVDLEIVSTSGDIVVRKGELGIVQVKGTRHTNPASEGRASNVPWQLPVRQDGSRIRIGGEEGGLAALLDYEIVAPAQTRLAIQTTSGDLSVDGIRGPVTISTGSGDIRANSLEEGLEAHTDSGDVTISLASGGKVEVKTASGDVRLHMPSQGGIDLSAHAASGDVSVASGLSLDGKATERSVVGKLRGGGPHIVISTASGDIHID